MTEAQSANKSPKKSANASPRAQYGVDAPWVVLGLAGTGVLLLLVGLSFIRFGEAIFLLGVGAFVALGGVICLAEAVLMVRGSLAGKPRLWVRLIDDLHLSGDEQVLDVGPGGGQQLATVARRLSEHGRAVGLDIWRRKDQAGNARDHTKANLRAEGVEERVELVEGDMRDMPFEDRRFDVVLSCLAIHNIPDALGREQALREIARVLKPGGRVVLIDFQHTETHAQVLRDAGCDQAAVSGRSLAMFPPVRVVSGRKAAALDRQTPRQAV